MMRAIKYIVVLLAAATMLGCLRDGAPDTVQPETGDQKEITIAFELLSDGEVALTRTTGHTREGYIETLDVLVFDVTDGEWNSVFLYSVHGFDIDNSDEEVSKNFKVSLKTAYNGRKIRLLAVVNAREAWNRITYNVTSGVTTDMDIFRMLTFDESMGEWKVIGPQVLPMSGISEEAMMSDNIKGGDFGKIELRRSVAGIDIDLAYGCNFALEDVVVRNIPHGGYVAPYYSLTMPGGVMQAPYTLNEYEFSVPYTVDGLHGMIYVPSKDPEHYSFSADRIFYILVGGRYSEDPAGFESAEKSWYRIDCPEPWAPEHSMSFENNIKYHIIIQSVNGAGYPKRELAEANGKTMWLNAAIISWEIGDYLHGEMDGPYCFDISCKEFEFDYKPRDIGSGDNQISLYTDYKFGWKVDEITYESEPTGWLDFDLGWGMPFQNGTLNILVRQNYSTNTARTGYIHLSAGRWKYKVKVTQARSTQPPSR